MKRCIKNKIDCDRAFDNWEGLFDRYKVVAFVIAGILSIILVVKLFELFDTVPATPSDYKRLEKQLNSIQQNPDLLFETESNIIVNNETITVELENEECKVIAEYDKNFKLLSTSYEDKSNTKLFAFINSFIVYACSLSIFGFLLTNVMVLINVVAIYVCKISKQIKIFIQKII